LVVRHDSELNSVQLVDRGRVEIGHDAGTTSFVAIGTAAHLARLRCRRNHLDALGHDPPTDKVGAPGVP
jgi:hypothetical protein